MNDEQKYDMANAANCHFIVAGAQTDCVGDGSTHDRAVCVPSSIFLKPASSAKVYSLISKLKNNLTVGVDGLATFPNKYVATEICDLVTHMINLMLSTAGFPHQLKPARVTPVYKGGGKKIFLTIGQSQF